MHKVLVTGGAGRIGSGLVKRLSELFGSSTEVYLLEHKNLIDSKNLDNLKNISIISDLTGQKYDLALHLAAVTDTKYCEKAENHERVREINVGLTEKVCNSCDRAILVSTERVFDANSGEFYESDDVNPSSFYGISKAEAEKVVIGGGGSIIRIQTMLGVKNRIIDSVLDAAQGKDYYPFWDNDYLRPCYFPDFFRVIKKVISGNDGICHVSCGGDALSRAEIANEVLRIYEENNIPLARKTIEFKSRKEGIRRIILNTDKTRKELGINFTDSRTALNEHIISTIAESST